MLRRPVITGYGEERQSSIGASDAETNELNLPHRPPSVTPLQHARRPAESCLSESLALPYR